MASVAGAQVSTDPATQSLTTDALGAARFSGVRPGFYSVTAIDPTLGSARAAVTIRGGALTEITLTLKKQAAGADAGVDGSPAPDTGTPPGTDGGPAPGTDGGGGDSADSGGGSAITLDPLGKDSNGINLSWSAPGASSFPSYRIYRAKDPAGGFEVIDILNAPATLTYRDEKAQLGSSYRYRVGGVRTGGQEVLSNIQTIIAGLFVAVNSQVERMKADPARPYLYAVDRVNNSLHFINLTANTLEKTIFIGSSPVDLDINIAGTELYVANFGSTEIAVVDLETRVKTRSLFVDTTQGTWDGNPYRLVCTAGNTLVFTSQDQWNDLKMVSAATGAHVATAGTLYTPQLARSPDGGRVYASGGTSGLTRFDVSGTALTQADVSGDSIGYGPVTVTRDGMYVFSGNQKLLTTNLKSVLGSFPESILAVTSDGALAVGMASVYSGTLFTTIKPLPLSTAIMALGADDKTLYLYDATSSRIYIYKL